MPSPINPQRPRGCVDFPTIAILALIGWFYLWTATSGAAGFEGILRQDDLYNRLSNGFLAGQLSFRELPNPAIAQLKDPWDPAQNGPLRQFHDVSYFDGRYFLYFGASPAVAALVPWKLLTGTYFPQNLATALFAMIGLCAAVATVAAVRRRYFATTPRWLALSCIVALGFSSFVPVLLRRPVYYEVAIAGAYAFASLALYFIVRALEASAARRWWLVLGGLAYGMAIAARPNYLFGAIVLAAPLLRDLRGWRTANPARRQLVIRDAVAVLAPLVVVGLVLATYNQLRFGDPIEFGTSYMFSGAHPQKDITSSFRFLPTNLWFYLLSPAQFTIYFPFVEVIPITWFKYPTGYSGEENVYGLLPNLPVLWALFLMPRFLRDRSDDTAPLRDFAVATLVLAGVDALVLFRVNGAANRYMVDLFFPLSVLACCAVLWASSRHGAGLLGRGLRLAWALAVGYTALLVGFVSIQHNELFRIQSPAAYGRMAHAFNHLSDWLGQTSAENTGPLRIRLTLPRDKKGKLEPLVVTGHSFRADFLYLFYTDDTHLQVGFEHTSYGGPMAKLPIPVDYGVEHVVEVRMGSLYPPVDHPYFDAMPAAEVTKLKRTFEVVLDGRTILSGEYDFYDASPGEVSVGSNPVQDAFGRKFTGKILSVERIH